jgi:hypothetical protein
MSLIFLHLLFHVSDFLKLQLHIISQITYTLRNIRYTIPHFYLKLHYCLPNFHPKFDAKHICVRYVRFPDLIYQGTNSNFYSAVSLRPLINRFLRHLF